MALITGPNKIGINYYTPWPVLQFCSVLGKGGGRKDYFELKRREDKLKLQIIKRKLMFIFTTKFIKIS